MAVYLILQTIKLIKIIYIVNTMTYLKAHLR